MCLTTSGYGIMIGVMGQRSLW